MLHSDDENFANAREARNVFNSICEFQALRTIDCASDTTITMEDIDEYKKENKIL